MAMGHHFAHSGSCVGGFDYVYGVDLSADSIGKPPQNYGRGGRLSRWIYRPVFDAGYLSCRVDKGNSDMARPGSDFVKPDDLQYSYKKIQTEENEEQKIKIFRFEILSLNIHPLLK